MRRVSHNFGLQEKRFLAMQLPKYIASYAMTLTLHWRISYHPTNLTCASSWSKLRGKCRLFVFAYIDDIGPNEFHARPYLIADLHRDFFADSPANWDHQNYGELHPSQIDQFSLIRKQYNDEASAPRLSLLKPIAEHQIKVAIAEILHEGHIPKDWGGEKSDLFTSNISVDGRMMHAAFLLKGPADFAPMTVRHLGRNGDQIERLFTEPAELLILQHCHSVTNAVRSMMRAYSCRVHDLRYFSILDGYDTIRLLRAYGKCGF